MEPRPLQYIAEATAGELCHGSPETAVSRLCVDSRQAQPGDLFFALAGERFDAHTFLSGVAERGVAAVVAERPKLPAGFHGCPVICVDNTRAALGRLGARYRRDFTLPVTVVGGSNGKTTTKELIASVLRQQRATLWSEASFNNEIGVPLTLLKLEHSHQAAVLEAGTNHPGELAPLLRMMAPHFGVITNIGREHLEFFGDLAGVAREEGAIAEALSPEGALFVNGDNEWTETIVRRCRARVVRVGFGEGNDWVARNVRLDDSGATFSVERRHSDFNGDYHIKLLGRHQVANALFALALGAELGLDRTAIAHGLAICAPAKMRLQLCAPGGIRVLDDAYNANADSMLAALQTLNDLPCAGRRVAVLGDMAELGESSQAAHAEVGRRAAEFHLDKLFTVGRRAGEIATAARHGGLGAVVEMPEVEMAARAVREFARPGDVVLIKASRAMRLERITEALQTKRKRTPGPDMLFYMSQEILAMARHTSYETMVSPLRLFAYITFRSAGAAVTALLLSWWLGPHCILWLKRLKFGQDYTDRAEEQGDLQARLISKRGTPTMGGLMMVLVLDVTALLWAQWNTQILLALLSVVVLCGLGFLDDYAKITKQNSRGVQEFLKLWVQGVLAVFVAIYLWRVPATSALISEVMVPFFKHPVLTGTAGTVVGVILTAMTIVGSSNAVNLTDGLDGLAIGCTAIVSFVFLVLTYLAGNVKASAYLQIPHIPGAGELTVFCAAMIGTSLGFLWFNCHPAQVFMGDTGSLALGGVLGMIAVLIHQPLVLAIAGGVFVAEAASVLIQRGWFKFTRYRFGEGRRVFLMAPLHHHFEKLGWYESQIVTRFYILCVLCAVVALSTLKIR